MWVNPERIGEDSKSRVCFFQGSNSGFPGLGGQLLGDGTQTNSNPYADVWARHIDQNLRDQFHASSGGPDPTWSPDAVLTDTVSTSTAEPRRDEGRVPISAVARYPGFIATTQTSEIYIN